MNSSEPALLAVRTQVQFELTEIAAEVVQAAALTARAQHEVTTSSRRCDSIERELRVAIGRSRVNPALLDTMRRIYHAARLALEDRQTRLNAAEQREQETRSALADLRNRERSLDRALQAARRKRRLREQALEMSIEDDLWLQHAWNEFR